MRATAGGAGVRQLNDPTVRRKSGTRTDDDEVGWTSRRQRLLKPERVNRRNLTSDPPVIWLF